MILWAVLACAPAPVAVSEGSLSGVPVREVALPNGMHAIVAADPSAPVVAYETWLQVGSADDPPGKGGLAHLFEHLMFKRTSEWADGDWDQRLGAAGAVGVNAWTWLDETVFVESVPKDALPLVAHMEAVRMSGLVVDDAAVDAEKKVVLDERRMTIDDDPAALVREALWKAAFPDHPYGRPTSGAPDEVAALTTADCDAFYRAHYAPDRATVVIVGDVDPDATIALLQKEYAGVPVAGKPRDPLPAAPPASAPSTATAATGDTDEPSTRVEVPLSVGDDRVAVGVRVPALSDADLAAIEVLDAALTAGQSSVLRTSLEKTGYAATVDSRVDGFRGPSVWEIGAWTHAPVGADALEPALLRLLGLIRQDGVSTADVDRGRAQLLSQRYRQLEDGAGRASYLGWWATGAGDWRLGAKHLDAIRAVTKQDVDRVAKELLAPERLVVAVGRGQGARADVVFPRTVTPETAEDVAARPLAGPPELQPGDVVDAEASGGRIHLEYDPTTPLLSLQIGWPVGSAADDVPGTANLAARALLRGTRARGRAAFEAAAERLGASVEVDVDPDLTVVRARVPAEGWPALAALLTEAISQPAYDPAEIDQLKGEMANRIALRRNDPSALGLRAFNAVYAGGDHPYGRSPLGSVDTLPKVTADGVRAFHDRWLRSGGTVVSLSGAFDAGARADLEAMLASIAGDPPALPVVPPVASSGRRVVVVDDPGLQQAFVVIGSAGPDAHHPLYPAYRLANEAFGGSSFTTRLVKEVRVARGLSYSVSSGAALRAQGPGAWAVTLSPPVAQVADAVKVVLDLMATAEATGMTADELAQVRQATTHAAPFLRDTAAKRGDLAFKRLLFGWDEADVRGRMVQASDADANAAFAKVLDPDGAVIVVVAPKDVAASLSTFGPVDVLPLEKVR